MFNAYESSCGFIYRMQVGRIVGEVHFIHNPRMLCILAKFSDNRMKQFQCD